MADKNCENEGGKVRKDNVVDKHRDRSRRQRLDEDGKKSRTEKEKKKSRKRSLSSSPSTSSSTSDSSEHGQKRKKHRKRSDSKKRKSKRSPSSSSDSEVKSRRKKRRSKKEKKSKKNKIKGVIDQKKYGTYGIIHESDIFVKQQEFYSWLQEVKNMNPETLPKFEMRRIFEDYMEDYNTATLPHKKYYDLEKWEAKRQRKNELKALKKARETSFSIVDDEKRHDMLHRRTDPNKYAGPSRQQLLEMQQELRRRQDEEYRKKAGLA